MFTRPLLLASGLIGLALFLALTPARATLITGWSFDNDAVAANASPAASTGQGTASSLGMTTNYNNTATAPLDSSDVLSSTGSSDGATTNVWRIRGGDGTNNPAKGAPNGWSSNAPIGTQGAQFLASTVGFTGIQVQFDWNSTTQGEANLQVQYTTNGTTYTNVPSGMYTSVGGATLLTNSASANTVTGSYLQATTTTLTFSNQITINLGSITAANNDAAFGIRLVDASTGADDVSTTSVTTAGSTPTMINNTSGNWRFDEVNISGVPEPGTFALAGLGLVGVAVLARRRARAA